MLVTAMLAATAAGAGGAGPASAREAAGSFTPALSSWRACSAGIECADLVVPLDYAKPDGQTITIAVSRKIHSGPAGSYEGVMLTNPGGPGGSGLGMALLADWVPMGAGKNYDWIGFDPRGVGGSSPALRCDSGYFGHDRPNYVPTRKKLMRAWLKRSKRYASACGRSAARPLLAHMTTRDTVRDMESLRIALSAEKISFYGFSYGSYLGQAYATAYPDRVHRMVLDGIVDPTTYWYQANLRQERAFDRNLNVFFRWIAKHDRVYRLGTKWRKIRAGFERELRVLDRKAAAGGKLGPDELTDALVDAGYYVYNWPGIAAAYSKLIRTGNGRAMFRLYKQGNMGDDNGYAVYNAVQCTDRYRPAWKKQKRDAWRIHRKHPFLAWNNTWFNAPCLTWSAPSQGVPAINGSGLAARGVKVLLINETRDAATPFSGALRMRSMFPTASLVAGMKGTTHAGSLSGVSCVDNAVARYLRDGTVPARRAGRGPDLRCPKVPTPRASGSARIASGGVPLPLRSAILTGQRPGLR